MNAPTSTPRPVDDRPRELRRVLGRAGVCTVVLVLSFAIPAGAEECTGTDTTLASSDCEGTVNVTTEEDTATVSTSLSAESETDDGPVDAGARVGVEEEQSADTPSYQGEERQVTVPGTQTPELTVTTPRIDIREPVDVQAGGETTIPSVTVEERRTTVGGTRYGVPDQEVNVDLFGSRDPDEESTIDQPVARGSGGGIVESAYDGTVATSSPVTGPDGHLSTDPSPDTPPSGTAATARGGIAGPAPRSPAGPTHLADGSGSAVETAIGTNVGTAVERASQLMSEAPSGLTGRTMTAWIAGAAMLALAGTGYLLTQRRSPVAAP